MSPAKNNLTGNKWVARAFKVTSVTPEEFLSFRASSSSYALWVKWMQGHCIHWTRLAEGACYSSMSHLLQNTHSRCPWGLSSLSAQTQCGRPPLGTDFLVKGWHASMPLVPKYRYPHWNPHPSMGITRIGVSRRWSGHETRYLLENSMRDISAPFAPCKDTTTCCIHRTLPRQSWATLWPWSHPLSLWDYKEGLFMKRSVSGSF